MDEENTLGINAKKENLSEWYTEVILKAKLADYGPVQGTIAYMPYSYAIWEKIQEIFNKMIKSTGHSNAYFPMFIPYSLLAKEREHLEGFVPEVFWVTYAGNSELNERIAIRPTSETIIYYFMQRWIRSWRDLPLLLNQWCNVARAETKATKPFLRGSEFLWQEGHTAHATKEEAEREVELILNFYKDIIENYLAIPVISGRKTELEKFKGAVYTMSLEALMPDGKAVQSATSHFLGQNFSKPFDIKFIDKDGTSKFVYTTSWGISTRLIGDLILVHGDNKGLIIPPKVAPIQVVIVPIYYSEKENIEIENYAKDLKSYLETNGISTIVDTRERSPGYKFNDWELKGVPLRIEIGPKEFSTNELTVARRDTGERLKVKKENLIISINEILDNIQKNLFERAYKKLKEMTFEVYEYDEFKKLSGKGFVKAHLCSNECEEKIKEETGMTTRVIANEKKNGKCIYCGKETSTIVYFAKSY